MVNLYFEQSILFKIQIKKKKGDYYKEKIHISFVYFDNKMHIRR